VVARYHVEHPLEPGVPTQLLRSQIRAHPELVDAALESQIAAGRVKGVGGAMATTGWAPKLASVSEGVAVELVSRLIGAGAEPPSVEELSAGFGRDLGPVLKFLERRGDVVQVEQNRYYAAANLKEIIARLRAIMGNGAEVGPSELREKLGLSRKFLIPVLEYCDRAGYTARSTGGRIWHGT